MITIVAHGAVNAGGLFGCLGTLRNKTNNPDKSDGY